jgi:hypothetical protein
MKEQIKNPVEVLSSLRTRSVVLSVMATGLTLSGSLLGQNTFPASGPAGVGTANPFTTLAVVGGTTGLTMSARYNFAAVQDAVNYRGVVLGYEATNQVGIIGGSSGGLGSQLAFWTVDNYATWGERMRLDAAGRLGIGTSQPCGATAPASCKLSVNGAIQAKEVVVNSGWADYVFQSSYRLRPLSEVKDFITKHRRLPDIPSADEVEKNGVGLGEMQAKLLAKVEELTLHMIRADERSNALERQNLELQEKVAALESRELGRSRQ